MRMRGGSAEDRMRPIGGGGGLRARAPRVQVNGTGAFLGASASLAAVDTVTEAPAEVRPALAGVAGVRTTTIRSLDLGDSFLTERVVDADDPTMGIAYPPFDD
jgi:hypothetical protein